MHAIFLINTPSPLFLSPLEKAAQNSKRHNNILSKMVDLKISNKPRAPVPNPIPIVAGEISAASSSAYESYLRLPELRKLWDSKDFPDWKNEPLLKPALQALEITFRFVSTALSDPRPYPNRREWSQRLESLAASQIHLVALLSDDVDDAHAPVADVTRTSEASLLPRLSTWRKSEHVAEKIQYTIECEMVQCGYTLSLGEPNLAGKPSLQYDAVCKPNELHALRRAPFDHALGNNRENQTLYTTHQILESWIHASMALLNRIVRRIESERFEQASSDCYSLERIWKLLVEIFDLHLLMDPDDFLHLKNRLGIGSDQASRFRSEGLVEIANRSIELRHKVPVVLGVEVDPRGGPRIQEAAMRLYRRERGGGGAERVHLLQAMQAVEAAVKRFFYGYEQVLVVVMGSLEAQGNRLVPDSNSGGRDSLSQIFLEPTGFPSLDAAKTFLGHFWSQGQGPSGL